MNQTLLYMRNGLTGARKPARLDDCIPGARTDLSRWMLIHLQIEDVHSGVDEDVHHYMLYFNILFSKNYKTMGDER